MVTPVSSGRSASPGSAPGTTAVIRTCNTLLREKWTIGLHYTLISHGLCLTGSRRSTTGGTQLIIQSCRDWTNQRWTRP